MLDSNKVPVSQSALLVIDAQDSFKLGSRWERRSNPAFEKNVTQLIEAYRAAHLPVVFFLHTDKDQGFARDSPSFKLMDFLKPRVDEPVSQLTGSVSFLDCQPTIPCLPCSTSSRRLGRFKESAR